MKTYDVCPQKLWTFDAPEGVMEESKSFIDITDFTYRPPAAHWQARSDSTELYREEGLKSTTSWFLDCCDRVKRHYDMPFEKSAINEMWINKENRGMSHRMHRHILAVFSGIFYITESNAGTNFYQKDWFVYDNPMMGFKQGSDFKRGKVKAPIKTEFPNSPGTLVIFPAGVMHEVSAHTLESPRYTISFNVFMSGKCGMPGGAGYVNLTVN